MHVPHGDLRPQLSRRALAALLSAAEDCKLFASTGSPRSAPTPAYALVDSLCPEAIIGLAGDMASQAVSVAMGLMRRYGYFWLQFF